GPFTLDSVSSEPQFQPSKWISAFLTPRVPEAPDPGELRASDRDRERVIAVLTEAAADGRLSLAEHEERVDQAWSARTLGELARLTTDLLPPESQPFRTDNRPVTAMF